MAEFDYAMKKEAIVDYIEVNAPLEYEDIQIIAMEVFHRALVAYKFGLGHDQALYADIFFKPLRQQLESVLAGRRTTEPV